MQKFIILFWLWLKVTASVEQSYSYYSGNDGTDKDPQVVIFYMHTENYSVDVSLAIIFNYIVSRKNFL